ncbi:MAG: hypothetical protein GF329_07390 [Candidatus Lokiarchaeota archaeon]|nr:hypothetical protein [Candidatus Lokiarchaeota archaeon]
MSVMEDFVKILKHDLHKVRTYNAVPHKNALPEKLMQKADGIAAWFSRNWVYQEVDAVTSFRRSILLHNGKFTRELAIRCKGTIASIFNESDPYKLHARILESTLLNMYHEAKNYPFTSLKYHLLLCCAFYYNLTKGNHFGNLYLCENQEPDSIFQVIYKDESREWALLPRKGMSRVLSSFSLSWARRTKTSIGVEDTVLDGLLETIKSWSTALATIEDIQLCE